MSQHNNTFSQQYIGTIIVLASTTIILVSTIISPLDGQAERVDRGALRAQQHRRERPLLLLSVSTRILLVSTVILLVSTIILLVSTITLSVSNIVSIMTLLVTA